MDNLKGLSQPLDYLVKRLGLVLLLDKLIKGFVYCSKLYIKKQEVKGELA